MSTTIFTEPATKLPSYEDLVPPKPPPQPSLLQRVQSIIAERGWCRNELLGLDGRVCLVGAAIFAVGETPNKTGRKRSKTGKTLDDIAREVFGVSGHTVERFNDGVVHDKEEAIEVCQRLDRNEEWVDIRRDLLRRRRT